MVFYTNRGGDIENTGEPLLQARIEIPQELRLKEEIEGRILDFGGDICIGDLRNTGIADFLVYRSIEGAHDGGGMKLSFLGAFTAFDAAAYAGYRPGAGQYNARLMD